MKRWAVRDGVGSLMMSRTDEIAVVDDKTFVFRLKKPFAHLPYALGKISTPMCAMGEPSGPIENGTTYIVRPFIAPWYSDVSSVRISSG